VSKRGREGVYLSVEFRTKVKIEEGLGKAVNCFVEAESTYEVCKSGRKVVDASVEIILQC
jgi:hypothetical protein